jgi:hypothetical protein
VTVISTIRHPADVLVSYLHHVRRRPELGELHGPGAMLVASGAVADLLTYVRYYYGSLLNLSVSWVALGHAHIVRYEELRHQTLETLTALTAAIMPVTTDQIQRAIEQSDIAMLRKLSPINPQFFRRGEVGSWRDELPAEVYAYLRESELYRQQMAALGYTFDPAGAQQVPVEPPVSALNPFRDRPFFADGVRVPELAIHLYLSIPTDVARRRWPDPHAAGHPETFYAWLNMPAERDPTPSLLPRITNLAAHVHWLRTDLRTHMPDPFGADRVPFALWFVEYVNAEYELDPVFVESIVQSMVAWAHGRDQRDFAGGGKLPALNNLTRTIYRKRPDVQKAYPNIDGKDRVAYLVWFFTRGMSEHRLPELWTRELAEEFAAWSDDVDPGDPLRGQAVPPITRMAAAVYHSDPHIRARFPKVYGSDRYDFLLWFSQLPFTQRQLHTVLKGWASMATHATMQRK